jgi:hypothetical protein
MNLYASIHSLAGLVQQKRAMTKATALNSKYDIIQFLTPFIKSPAKATK